MLTKERVRVIGKLAVPITLALSSSLVMSVIDLAMVGRLGSTAVAAVGLASFCYSLVTAFVIGAEPAVQGLVARRRGEGSPDPQCRPLNAGLLAAVLVGAPLTVGCWVLARAFFSFISSDPAVTGTGVPYLEVLYLSVIGVGINAAFQGFWNGMEKPGVYMAIVVFMNAINIVLNYALIFGHFGVHPLGAMGAAVGTTTALYLGVAVNSLLCVTAYRREGFLVVGPSRSLLALVLKMSTPSTVQGFFFSGGFIVFLWLVGQVGTAALAAANVLVRITILLTVLAVALGMVSATLVSKSVGEGKPIEAARWGWDTGAVGIITITLLGVPLFLFPQAVLGLFLTDPHAIAMAVVPLRLIAATTGLGSLIYIFSYTLFALGDGKRVILVSFSTQWILFLPGVWLIGLRLHEGLLGIWLVQMAYGTTATVLITAIWMQGRWKRLTLQAAT